LKTDTNRAAESRSEIVLRHLVELPHGRVDFSMAEACSRLSRAMLSSSSLLRHAPSKVVDSDNVQPRARAA
jgi:hypothetical protein